MELEASAGTCFRHGRSRKSGFGALSYLEEFKVPTSLFGSKEGGWLALRWLFPSDSKVGRLLSGWEEGGYKVSFRVS